MLGVNDIKVISITSSEIKCEVICNYYIDLEHKEVYTMSYSFVLNKSFGNWKASYFELPY